MRVVLALSILSVAAALAWATPAAAATPTPDIMIDAGDFWFCDSSFDAGVCETQVDLGTTVEWVIVAGIHTVTDCGGDCDNPT
ncbi:MAG: hypothetical protein WD939_01400, partial [Dehalococcoidia bacterium]